jgi:hypothetical protein
MKNYEITEEQIKQNSEKTLKELFPEVFETKLEIGKWYKIINGNTLAFICEPKKNEVKSYGFSNNIFYDDTLLATYWGYMYQVEGWVPATDSEVLEALKNEAIKRGLTEKKYILSAKSGMPFKSFEGNYYIDEEGCLRLDGVVIMKDGKWAEIIKTYTKEEAEKILNAKII